MLRIVKIIWCVIAVIGIMTGCKKQVSTLQEQVKPVAETVAEKPVPVQSIDTSDNAVFREAQLSEDVAREAKEKLKTMYFEYDSYQLSQDNRDQLLASAAFLNNTKLRVLLEGHCDERGSAEYNMGLGENRARVVKEYLVNLGVPAVQMETTSWGKEQPEQSGCADDACHKINRRVQFKVLER